MEQQSTARVSPPQATRTAHPPALGRPSALLRFTPDNCKPKASEKLSFSISKGSAFRISKDLTTAMGLKSGDRVAMLCAADDPKVWFLVRDKNGFTVSKNKDGSARFTCVELCRRFKADIGYKPPAGSMPVDKDPVMLEGEQAWVLVTERVKSTWRELENE